MKRANKKRMYLFAAVLLVLSLSACAQAHLQGEAPMRETQTEDPQMSGAPEGEAQGEGRVDEITLEISELADYKVVYPQKDKNAKLLAQWLVNKLSDQYELTLELASDVGKAKGREILIGTTNRRDCLYTSQELELGTYLTGVSEQYICARGLDAIGDHQAVSDLIAVLLGAEDVAGTVTVVTAVETLPMRDTLKSMSFNIYVGNRTEQRMMSVVQTILGYLPDTIGIQEATPEWMSYLKENLGDFYGFAGTGREGGKKGEYCAILYRKDRFELVETDTKWLSDTPDECSKYEESKYYRIFTYAILSDRMTGGELVAVNTHLDNASHVAREKQVKILLEHLEQFSGKPVVLTGDFNSIRGSNVYKTVTEVFVDSCKIALEKVDKPTLLSADMKVIDFVFVSSHIAEVLDYCAIAAVENGMLPSDHLPVLIEYTVEMQD